MPNLYWTQALFDAAFANETTDDLAEGLTNLYFTIARARAVLNASPPISYNATTGSLSIPMASASASGYLSSLDWTTFHAGSSLSGVPTSRTISTTAPLSGGGDLTADRVLGIVNAAADGVTKGAAAFASLGFTDNGSGVISLRAPQQVYINAGSPNGVITVNTTLPCICLDTTNNVTWQKTDGLVTNTGWV
jgi:hypothetical protein